MLIAYQLKDNNAAAHYGIRALMYKRQNQSSTKSFWIHHESGTISSSLTKPSLKKLVRVTAGFTVKCFNNGSWC